MLLQSGQQEETRNGGAKVCGTVPNALLSLVAPKTAASCLANELTSRGQPLSKRTQLARQLASLDPSSSVLLRLLSDRSENLELRTAIFELVKSNNGEAVMKTLAAIASDSRDNSTLRFNALSALDSEKWPHYKLELPGLISVIGATGDSVLVRNRCARLLQRLRPPAAIPALIRAASGGDRDLSREALEALWSIRPEGGFRLDSATAKELGQRLFERLATNSGSQNAFNLRHRQLLIRLLADGPNAAAGEVIWKALRQKEPADGNMNPGMFARSDFGYWLNAAADRDKSLDNLKSALESYAQELRSPAEAGAVRRYMAALQYANRHWPYSVFRFRPDHLTALTQAAEHPARPVRLAVMVKGTIEGLGRHALYRTEAEVANLLAHGYTVQYHEADSRRSFLDKVLYGERRYGPADLLLLDSHGSSQRLYFRDRDPHPANADPWEHTIGADSVSELLRAGLGRIVKRGGHVIYGGCDGGAGGRFNPHNLANGLHPVWAVRRLRGEWSCSRLVDDRKLRFARNGALLRVDFVVSLENRESSLPAARRDDEISYNASR